MSEVRTYGPSYRPVKEDTARCIESVPERDSRWPIYHQCSRKRGHGPDGLYCKTHDPDAVKKRRKEADERADVAYNKQWAPHVIARIAESVLTEIAKGHNDPRELARETLARFRRLREGKRDERPEPAESGSKGDAR